MKTVQTSIIDGKQARLVLLNDNKTLKIFLGTKCVRVLQGLWNDIRDDEWAQVGILEKETECYIRKQQAKEELEALARELF